MRNLEQIAINEATQRKAPCKYLGWKRQDGRYESDPAKWPEHAYPDGKKTHAIVFYEWMHVKRGSDPYRVECHIRNVLNAGRPVPWNPLNPTSMEPHLARKDCKR